MDKIVLQPDNYYVTFWESFGMHRVKKERKKGE